MGLIFNKLYLKRCHFNIYLIFSFLYQVLRIECVSYIKRHTQLARAVLCGSWLPVGTSGNKSQESGGATRPVAPRLCLHSAGDGLCEPITQQKGETLLGRKETPFS